MKIVLMHYHLKTGGVTTVIRQQVRALKHVCDILVLTGEPPEVLFPCETVHIQGLGYDNKRDEPLSSERIAASITNAIHGKWRTGCDVLHVHNPTLAKNRRFLKILDILKKESNNLLLQIHDFSEDGRPGVYFHEQYPSDCHYSVINSRDYQVLRKSGLKPEGLHLIPNTVNPLPCRSAGEISHPIVLYPVRAIRRKNIGEAILLSLYFPADEKLCISQPPNSPEDIASYTEWKNFIEANKLCVTMEAGARNSFEELVGRSRYLLTTSIGEGFGFSFLEPWTAGKLLWGRKLPDLCSDFEKKGVRLDHLYTKIRVPIEWFEHRRFRDLWRTVAMKCADIYGYSVSRNRVEVAFRKISADGMIDFGQLDESSQMQVLSHLLADPDLKEQLALINPHVKGPRRVSGLRPLIGQNREVIQREFTIERYRQILLDTYRRVLDHSVRHRIDKASLFKQFFNLDSFSLLKWSEYGDSR